VRTSELTICIRLYYSVSFCKYSEAYRCYIALGCDPIRNGVVIHAWMSSRWYIGTHPCFKLVSRVLSSL
jgi:hypothetical protein